MNQLKQQDPKEPRERTPMESTKDEVYDEEKDPTTPYLNPGYRADLYENTWGNIVLIIVMLALFLGGAFGYYMIFFGPLTTNIMYHDNMWWGFLIVFGLTLVVRLCRAIIVR